MSATRLVVNTLPILFFLAACGSERDPAVETLEQFAVDWRKLDDGSDFGRVGRPGGEIEGAIRCWSWQDDLRRCVEVGKSNGAGFTRTSVQIVYPGDLPAFLVPTSSADGYRCHHLLGYREQIARDGEALVSNALGHDSPRWSRSYVAEFMAGNGVKGQNYFDCLGILELIHAGSLETLSTTEVRESMVQ